MSWSRCSSLILALRDSIDTASSAGGVMLERIGSWFTGVVQNVLETYA